jgi:hypothetical protein
VNDDQAMKNLKIIGSGLSAGLPIELATLFCKPLARPAKQERVLSEQDRQRIAAAEAKRQRRARRNSAPSDSGREG